MKKNKLIIFVSAGHYEKSNGVNSGAYDKASDTSEYELNGQFASKLFDECKLAGIDVYMIPRKRVMLSRLKVASKVIKAQKALGYNPVVVYLSLHQNSYHLPAQGAETFVSNSCSKSLPIADRIQNILVGAGLRDRGVKFYSWYMLRSTSWATAGIFSMKRIYACLIEFGFITDKYDREIITDSVKQQEICNNIVTQITEWYNSSQWANSK